MNNILAFNTITVQNPAVVPAQSQPEQQIWHLIATTGNRWSVHQGNSLTTLKLLSDESVHCVVTSPPYFWLRDYGVDQQIGLEKTAGDYVTAVRSRSWQRNYRSGGIADEASLP